MLLVRAEEAQVLILTPVAPLAHMDLLEDRTRELDRVIILHLVGQAVGQALLAETVLQIVQAVQVASEGAAQFRVL